jgi:hypothetical protein
VTFASQGEILLAVNAGSDTGSVFLADGSRLFLSEIVPPEGNSPHRSPFTGTSSTCSTAAAPAPGEGRGIADSGSVGWPATGFAGCGGGIVVPSFA